MVNNFINGKLLLLLMVSNSINGIFISGKLFLTVNNFIKRRYFPHR